MPHRLDLILGSPGPAEFGGYGSRARPAVTVCCRERLRTSEIIEPSSFGPQNSMPPIARQLFTARYDHRGRGWFGEDGPIRAKPPMDRIDRGGIADRSIHDHHGSDSNMTGGSGEHSDGLKSNLGHPDFHRPDQSR
jgi:hypothetical protein